jgi:DNA-binding NarL/FixJ family response regulator
MRQLTKHSRRWIETIKQLSTEFLSLIAWLLVKVTILKLAASAHGYISKGVGENGLKAALWAVYKNEASFVSPEFRARLLSAAQNSCNNAPNSIDLLISRRTRAGLGPLSASANNSSSSGYPSA